MQATYQGQFGPFTIDESDRRGVKIYRSALIVMAGSSAVGVGWWSLGLPLVGVTAWYALFCLALGLALATVHIYMVALHRTLQIFWGIGVLASLGIALSHPEPLAWVVYQQPWTLWGIGFTFAALTGLLIKETFCFRWTETTALVPLVPLLLLGHLFGLLPATFATGLLLLIAVLLLAFAARKTWQPLDPDIGDKSVFAYLKQAS